MECYRQFPVRTVVFNGITLGGAQVIGILIAAQFGPWPAVAYAALQALAVILVLGTICRRCSYYGRRCALALGKIAPALFSRGRPEQFFKTAPQFVAIGLLGIGLLLPAVGGVILVLNAPNSWRWALLLLWVALFLTGLVPHTRLVCRHCCQGESGDCPIGRKIWNGESPLEGTG
jgi:hypothetical protein